MFEVSKVNLSTNTRIDPTYENNICCIVSMADVQVYTKVFVYSLLHVANKSLFRSLQIPSYYILEQVII